MRATHSRYHIRDHLPAVPAIDAKIVIGAEEYRVSRDFRHADEAGVGETHGDIRILVRELQDRFEFTPQVEACSHGASTEQLGQPRFTCPPEQTEGLRQNGITGSPRRSEVRHLSGCPAMMPISTAEERAKIRRQPARFCP